MFKQTWNWQFTHVSLTVLTSSVCTHAKQYVGGASQQLGFKLKCKVNKTSVKCNGHYNDDQNNCLKQVHAGTNNNIIKMKYKSKTRKINDIVQSTWRPVKFHVMTKVGIDAEISNIFEKSTNQLKLQIKLKMLVYHWQCTILAVVVGNNTSRCLGE